MNCGAKEVKRISSDVVNLPYVWNIFQNLPAYLAMDLRKNLCCMYIINQKNILLIFFGGGKIMSFCPSFFLGGNFMSRNIQKNTLLFKCSKKCPLFVNFILHKVPKNPQKGDFCMSVRNIFRGQNIPHAQTKSGHELSRAQQLYSWHPRKLQHKHS